MRPYLFVVDLAPAEIEPSAVPVPAAEPSAEPVPESMPVE